MYIPKLIVKKINTEYNINFISNLLVPKHGIKDNSLPFKDRVYGLLPELKEKINDAMSDNEIHIEVEKVIKKRLYDNKKEIENQVEHIQDEFNKIYIPIMKNMLNLFELEWNTNEKYLTCYLGCCPVFPRDVLKKEFCVNYSSTDERIIRSSLHEINHFVLFEKWKAMHGYNSNVEPMHPEPLWFLEEISVDPTLNQQCIQSIVPYEQLAYSQFYNAKINNISIMDNIKFIYSNKKSMADFLDKSYAFILRNINKIQTECG